MLAGMSLIMATLLVSGRAPQQIPVTVQPDTEKAVVKEAAEERRDKLGKFRVTAYCPCRECSEGYGRRTSTGRSAHSGRTIAVDPDVIPYGTHVQIGGHEYIAEDCGGVIIGNRIDIFFDTHGETEEFGVQWLDVYVLDGGTDGK